VFVRDTFARVNGQGDGGRHQGWGSLSRKSNYRPTRGLCARDPVPGQETDHRARSGRGPLDSRPWCGAGSRVLLPVPDPRSVLHLILNDVSPRVFCLAGDMKMWPSIFGPGWVWGALIALAFLCLVLGVLGFMFLVIFSPPREADDPTGRLWHRFEEGDLTKVEFERFRHAGRTPVSPRGINK